MSYLEIATAGTDVARDAHYVTPTGWTVPIRTLLLEPQRTNLCIRSEEFDTWTNDNVSVTSNAATAPDGALTADVLAATTANTNSRTRSVTFTGDGEKCAAFFLKAGTAPTSSLSIRDTTVAVNRHRITVTWNAGVPTLSTQSGAGTLYPTEALGNGWYRILFSATGIIAANAHTVGILPDSTGTTGTVYAWGAQAENAVVPSSYIKTEATTVTRNADSLYFDVPALNPPRAMTVYVRGVEQSNPAVTGAGLEGILNISDAASADPRVLLYKQSTTAGYRMRHDPAATTDSDANPSATRGDIVELRGVLSSGGAPTLGATRNGGAEVVGTTGAAQALGVAWSEARLYLNSIGSAGIGQFAYTHVLVAAGEQTMNTMRQLAGVV